MSHTAELRPMNRRLLEAGVRILPNRVLAAVRGGAAELACVFTGAMETVPARTVVLVTMRREETAVHDRLAGDPEAMEASGIRTVRRIGDCWAPGIIAEAVHGGTPLRPRTRRRESRDLPYRVEYTTIKAGVPF